MNFIEFVKFEWSSGNWFQKAMIVAMVVLITFMFTTLLCLIVALVGSMTAKQVTSALFVLGFGGGFISLIVLAMNYEDWNDRNGKPRKKLTNFGPK